jgi:carbamoyl-phosphate synthase large subunit
MEAKVRSEGLPEDAVSLRGLKAMGFSDERLGELSGMSARDVTARRAKAGVHPVYKRIDTCAAEFASPTPYMYSTYETGLSGPPSCEADPSERDKIIILGGGPNRIGQGIEFDYCCCHAAFSLSDAGFETIMVNCNPETVSTDYDTSDRLYFEPLTEEDVLEIVRTEQARGTLKGVIVQFGGQTPLKLAAALERENVPILGTSPDAIDLAEDRDRFKALIEKLKLTQPRNGIARSAEEAKAIAGKLGFPVVIRPSYVLGGRAMEIVHDQPQLDRYISEAVVVSGDSPVLIDSYLRDAIEVDVDALADGTDVFVAGVMEHIEEAGVHSGDSACSLPPHSLSDEIIAQIKQQSEALAKALGVVGLMNVQFAIKDGEIFILEVNPRASRTVPFVSKAVGIPVAGIAARLMAGEQLADMELEERKFDHIAVKEAVFPFARFPGVDPVLGPEMRSTGEVMGIDTDYATAFAKSQLGAGANLPTSGTVFVSVRDADKEGIVSPVRALLEMGFKVVATGGTKRHLESHGIPCKKVNKVLEGRPHVVDAMKNSEVDIVFNTTEGAKALADSTSLRRTALLYHIPYYTTLQGAMAVTRAIEAIKADSLKVAPLQSYVS